MCTRPLSVVHSFCNNRFTKVDIVPCGKCDECLLRKKAEFACLATMQARKAKSVDFVTLSYAPAHLPIMRSDVYPVDNLQFDDHPDLKNLVMDSKREAVCTTDAVTNWCPSLRREDVRLAIKSARQAYLRKYGELPSFTYAGFGEYG